PVTALAAQAEAVANEIASEPKAKTIAELAARYDSSSCMECHEEIHAEWEKSLHARSIFGHEDVARTAATIKTSIENGLEEWPHSGVKKPEDVQVKHLMMCAKCHLPQLAEAEDSVAKEIVKNIYAYTENPDNEEAKAALESLNIGCMVCHNRNAITHKWTDGYPEKGTVYGTTDGEHEDPDHPRMKASKIMKESIACGQCHGLGPNFELDNPSQCATLYASHLFAYIPEGGQGTCQECHMEKSKLGHNIQSYREPVMAKMAVDVEVEAKAYQWRDGSTMTPVAQIAVLLTNKAGHAIPDG
ncbi:MAG TPA: cytochrome C, partial [Desulfobulbaceae bacterium]|nr:cytochrome C [Desulfobulbaceae bacterium]